jgi:hypothetical protein
MDWVRAGFSAIGLLAIVAAVIVSVVDSVGAILVGVVSGFDSPVFLIGTGLGMITTGALIAWIVGNGSNPSDTAYDSAVESPPEYAQQSHGRRSAATVQAEVTDANAGDSEAMEAVVNRLREIAITTCAVSTGMSTDDATRSVTAGTWTDDRTAAAMLSGDESHSIFARLRLWLDPNSERERRIERTIEAIQRLGGENSD